MRIFDYLSYKIPEPLNFFSLISRHPLDDLYVPVVTCFTLWELESSSGEDGRLPVFVDSH